MAKIQALYSRVSTDIQRDKGFSIPRQKEWLTEEASRHHFSNPTHYTDNGYSAKDTNRPALTRLLADIENDKVDSVVVYKYDRIARNLKDLIVFLELLNNHNINFVSIAERFDTTSAIGKAMLNMTGTFAQLERDTTVERVRDAMWNKAGKGDFCGGQAPYGYDIKDKKLVINEEESKIIKEMYNRFEEIRSLRGITIWLNKMGYKTKRGTTWASSSVRRILTNILYTGYYTYGKRANGSKIYLPQEKWLIIKGDFSPLIPQEQFTKVSAIIRQKKFTIPQRKYDEVYILSGLMRCECGGSLNGYTMTKKDSGKLYSYYKCHNHISKGNGICSGNALRKDFIEKHILEEVIKQAKLYFEDNETIKVLEKKKRNNPQERLTQLKDRISSLKSKQKKLLSLYEDGSIAKDLLIERMDRVTLELDEAENQYRALESELNPQNIEERSTVLGKVNHLKENLLSLSDKVKKDILRQLIKQITVARSKDVEIELYQL